MTQLQPVIFLVYFEDKCVSSNIIVYLKMWGEKMKTRMNILHFDRTACYFHYIDMKIRFSCTLCGI